MSVPSWTDIRFAARAGLGDDRASLAADAAGELDVGASGRAKTRALCVLRSQETLARIAIVEGAAAAREHVLLLEAVTKLIAEGDALLEREPLLLFDALAYVTVARCLGRAPAGSVEEIEGPWLARLARTRVLDAMRTSTALLLCASTSALDLIPLLDGGGPVVGGESVKRLRVGDVRGLARRFGSILKGSSDADGKRAFATLAWREFVQSFPLALESGVVRWVDLLIAGAVVSVAVMRTTHEQAMKLLGDYLDELDFEGVRRELLSMLEARPEGLGWHALATGLSRSSAPRSPDMMVVLKELEKQGDVVRLPGHSDTTRWLRTPEACVDPTFVATLCSGMQATIESYGALITNPSKFDMTLRREIEAFPEAAHRMVWASSFLPDPLRSAVVRELASHKRVDVRRALFATYAPPRLAVQGAQPVILSPADVDAIAEIGLVDADTKVRGHAAALLFASGRAAPFAARLVRNLDSPDYEVQWATVLALGSAADAASLAALRSLVRGGDRGLAGAAVRALAARPDGRADAEAALADERPDVRDAASFALRTLPSNMERG